MGERTAYRVKSKDGVSPFLRKQFGIFRTEEIKELVYRIAEILCDGEVIGSGLGALRDDLEIAKGRLFLALCKVLARTPFDEILNENELFDVSDHGLFEIEIVKWNKWIVWHYNVSFFDDKIIEESKEKVLEVEFEEGKPLSEGIKFTYVSKKKWW